MPGRPTAARPSPPTPVLCVHSSLLYSVQCSLVIRPQLSTYLPCKVCEEKSNDNICLEKMLCASGKACSN
jgi:hypothetical protein